MHQFGVSIPGSVGVWQNNVRVIINLDSQTASIGDSQMSYDKEFIGFSFYELAQAAAPSSASGSFTKIRNLKVRRLPQRMSTVMNDISSALSDLIGG